MAGGFDAGAALRAGLGDRRQAWEFIRRFAAGWVGPLAPGDGVSRDTWRAAEQHIGAELPAALREAYLLFGRRPDLTARQDRLVPPRELGFDDSGTAVVFRVENQYCAEWGVAVADLASSDPPVYVRDRSRGGWEPFLDRVSVACVEMVLSEVLLGAGKLGNACPLPGELITVVESAYEQMALPEYPLWTGNGITMRWFSAPGKLLRMRGADRIAGCLHGAGPRPTWNRSVRRSPGPGSRRGGHAKYLTCRMITYVSKPNRLLRGGLTRSRPSRIRRLAP